VIGGELHRNNYTLKSGGYEVKEGQQSVGGLIPKTPRGVKDDNYPLTDYSTVSECSNRVEFDRSYPLHQGSLNKSSTEQLRVFAIFNARTVDGT